jgi:hypothetical protein
VLGRPVDGFDLGLSWIISELAHEQVADRGRPRPDRGDGGGPRSQLGRLLGRLAADEGGEGLGRLRPPKGKQDVERAIAIVERAELVL